MTRTSRGPSARAELLVLDMPLTVLCSSWLVWPCYIKLVIMLFVVAIYRYVPMLGFCDNQYSIDRYTVHVQGGWAKK